MSDKPILFSGPMVRALLAGTKTQTRRVPKILQQAYVANDNRQSDKPGLLPGMRYWNVSGAVSGRIMLEPDFLRLLPHRVGDRLYVREHWRTGGQFDHLAPRDLTRAWAEPIGFVADEPQDKISRTGKFRQGMHMPRWASRITLTVTDVRVERLQDISEADALAEGIVQHGRFFGVEGADWDEADLSAVAAYRRLWTSINGAGSWEASPWVAAYTFTVHMGNIDEAIK